MSAGKYQRVTRKKANIFLVSSKLFGEHVGACASVCSTQTSPAYEIWWRRPVCTTHSNHTAMFAIISAIALYMSSAAHRAYADLTACFCRIAGKTQRDAREGHLGVSHPAVRMTEKWNPHWQMQPLHHKRPQHDKPRIYEKRNKCC